MFIYYRSTTDKMSDDVISQRNGGLENFDSLSAILSALAVVLITVVWLLKVYYVADGVNEQRTTVPVNYPIVQQQMQQVTNPFVVTLQQRATLEGGAILTVSSQVRSCLVFFWAVDIESFYKQINAEWSDFAAHCTTAESLFGSCCKKVKRLPEELSPCEQKSISVPACNISMGQTPRSVFPLVVLIYDSNLSCDEFADSTVMALISVFHLKDGEIATESHAIAQYARLPLRAPVHLQNVYQTTGAADEQSETDEPAAASSQVSSCIVCGEDSVTIVLLPCRHSCLCDTCLSRVTQCPVCRSNIDSYFRTNL